MNKPDDRLMHLEQQMGALLRRLEVLEGGPTPLEIPETVAERPGNEGNLQGTLAYTAFLRSGQQRFKIQAREDLSKLVEIEPDSVARAFAALGSPFRILLLRALLQGPRTSQELQAELNVGPVGQLYHHLKELLAAGLIVQRKRSVYAIREEKLLPICVVVVAALRLIADQEPMHAGAQTPDETESREEPEESQS